jgi:hypothetical protein
MKRAYTIAAIYVCVQRAVKTAASRASNGVRLNLSKRFSNSKPSEKRKSMMTQRGVRSLRIASQMQTRIFSET